MLLNDEEFLIAQFGLAATVLNVPQKELNQKQDFVLDKPARAFNINNQEGQLQRPRSINTT